MKCPSDLDEPAQKLWQISDEAQRAEWSMYKTYSLREFRIRFKKRFRVRLELARKKFL